MPLIVKPSAFTCRGERLARAAASPHGSITRPSGKGQGVGPSCDAGKEMTLGVGSELIWGYVLDAAFVDDAGRDVASVDEVADPVRGVGLDLVVEVQDNPLSPALAASFARYLSQASRSVLPFAPLPQIITTGRYRSRLVMPENVRSM